MKNLLTIITRTYGKRGNFLKNAYNSILAQTYRPIEWLIIEDGSSQAPDCLDNNAFNTGVDVRIIRNEKLGRSAAANRGIDEAKGVYICFLDDDDELMPNHGEVLISLLEKYVDAAGAYGAAYQSSRFDESPRSPIINEDIHFDPIADSIVFLERNIFPIQAVIFRKKIIHHQRFDLNLDALEDWLFWCEIFLEKKLVWTPEVTSRFYVPADLEIKKARLDTHRNADAAFKIQIDAFLLERGINNYGKIMNFARCKFADALIKAEDNAEIT